MAASFADTSCWVKHKDYKLAPEQMFITAAFAC